MTHAELVRRAERWLRNVCRCGVVLCESQARTGETPDAIGWTNRGGRSVLVECKISRADFLADKQKPFRREGCVDAMGCNRYYLTLPGIIKHGEAMPLWGLLELTGSGIKCRWKSGEFHPTSAGREAEMSMLWTEVRLIQLAKAGFPLFPSKRAARIEQALKGNASQ